MEIFKKEWHEHKYFKATRGLLARHWPIIAWIASFILIAYSVWQVNIVADQNRDTINDTRASIIASCENSRNPLQNYFFGEIAAVKANIEQTRSSDLRNLFPTISDEQYQSLLDESIMKDQQRKVRLKKLVRVFDPQNCEKAYKEDR